MATELTTREELTDTLAILATARGTHTARLARMHRTMLASPDAMRECGLPSGAKRAALTEAMTDAQTPKGKRYAACIVCGEPMSPTVAQTHPAFPNLMILISSALFADDDTTGTDKATAHRLGFVPGNVALACTACVQWKMASVRAGNVPIFDAETLGAFADRVLLSWEGIGYVRKSDEETSDAAESRERREAARIALGYAS